MAKSGGRSIAGIPVPSTRMIITGAIVTVITLWFLKNTNIGRTLGAKVGV